MQEEFSLPRATCLSSDVGLFKSTGEFVIFGSGIYLSKDLQKKERETMI